MTQRESGESGRERVTFGSSLFTSGIVILAAVAIFLVINSFKPHDDKGYSGLISSTDGTILVQRDGDLRIESVSFRDYMGDVIPVDIRENPGHKIKAVVLMTGDKTEGFDINRTLRVDAIEPDALPVVPQIIQIEVSDKKNKGDIELYLITDQPYMARRVPGSIGFDKGIHEFEGQIGVKGVKGFITIENDGIYLSSDARGFLPVDEGPVAILMAVRKQGKKAVGRSQLVLVKRKGILHPGDKWFDEFKTGYFSLPYVGDRLDTSRIAFETEVQGAPPRVVTSALDFKHPYDISSLFPEGPISVDHWGKTEGDYDIVYVFGDFGDRLIYQVKVGQAEAIRIEGAHSVVEDDGASTLLKVSPDKGPIESE